MTAILFVVGCVGFALVIAWAYGLDAREAGSDGGGLLAMVDSTLPAVRDAPRPSRWNQDVSRKAGAKTRPGKPDAARPATQGWPRHRRGA